jgi:Eukaryotic protein of unknown function (DUF829)
MSEVNDSSSLNPSISINDLSPSISAENLSPSVAVEQLSPNTSLYQPKVSTAEDGSASTPSLKHPNLILLFSWTGAQQKHITKYTSAYFARFPSTPIMVITTSIKDLTYRTSSKKRRALLPAIAAITCSPTLNTNILLHAFSEGGSSTSVHFAKAFLAQTHRRLPLTALILDSCPGTLHFTNLAHTARNTVPNNPTAQVFASLTAYTIIASYWTTFLLIGDREDVDDPKDLNAKTKIALNDPTLWDTMVPRAYLFSKADKLIHWQSVLEHARDAESRGTLVFVELFEKSSHCAHIRAKEDAERYWSAVQKVWDRRADGVSELVEDEAGERKKDGVEVKVEEVDVKLQALGLRGSRPTKKRCTCSDCGR